MGNRNKDQVAYGYEDSCSGIRSKKVNDSIHIFIFVGIFECYENPIQIIGSLSFAKESYRQTRRIPICVGYAYLFLYIGAELAEPHVWATLTTRDSVVYHDNDFEVFIDPEGDERDYIEIEINAFNTIFDLLLKNTYLRGGPAIHDWNVKNLRSAVYVNGTLNDPSDFDRGWSVELAIPWKNFNISTQRSAPPEQNDIWRMNFSRVQWKHIVLSGRYQKIPNMPEENSVWSPQGEINMHIPHRWGYVLFVDMIP